MENYLELFVYFVNKMRLLNQNGGKMKYKTVKLNFDEETHKKITEQAKKCLLPINQWVKFIISKEINGN